MEEAQGAAPPAGDRLWSIEDGLERLGGISRTTLYRWEARGIIKLWRREGVAPKIPQSEIDRIIAADTPAE